MNQTLSPPLAESARGGSSGDIVKKVGLAAALVALLAIVLMPTPQGLPQAGQVMLAILAFAVIVWMTEALDYAASSVVIGALMVFLLAYVPDATKAAGPDMGTGAALNLALTGFSNSAVVHWWRRPVSLPLPCLRQDWTGASRWWCCPKWMRTPTTS